MAIYTLAALAWLPLRHVALSSRSVVVIALALRAMLFVPEPLLSGDVYRYLSDGRVLASGGNPYEYTPSDPRINHPEIRSIYPPHAQLLFAAVHELHAWRLLIILADLCAIFFLRRYAFAYATCPLVLFEGTWSGHIDALAAVLLAVAFVRKSGAAAGFAVGLKITPVAALPAFFRQPAGKPGSRAAAFLTVLLLPILPFLGKPIMPGLRDYATRWIFASPAYELVFAIVSRIPTKTIWTHHPLRFEAISDFVYRHLYPDFLTRAILAAIALGCIALARRASTAIAALLLCSPANHPWYWLVLVPLSLLERTRWIYIALCMPLTYLLYEGL
ncbi:MAG TPA: hypothetical protein VNA69_02365 [Thermoanaerobaculia bacterium]|nr:hypothetical protein [Thermoanaerobaculia bacterium]